MIFIPYRLLFAHVLKNIYYFWCYTIPETKEFNHMLTKTFSKFQQTQLKNSSSTLFNVNSNNEKPTFSKILTFVIQQTRQS